MTLFRLLLASTTIASSAAHADIDMLMQSQGAEINRAPTIGVAAKFSSGAYNDKELVGLQYSPLRDQKGFKGREELVNTGYEVASFHAKISERKSAPAGIVAYKEVAGKAQLTVAFHGSEATEDFTQANLLFFKTQNPALGIGGKVHTGFNSRYMQSREAMMDLIKDTLGRHGKSAKDVEIVVTGHSLGGALATLAAADIKTNLADAENLKLVTFSSPRVVSHAGAESIEKAIGKGRIVRIWRDGDIVPSALLGAFGYKHVGTSVKLESKTGGKLSLVNHDLSSIVEDATSHTTVKPLAHEGYTTWLKRKITSIPRAISNSFKNFFKRG